jgi:hypothetical protein
MAEIDPKTGCRDEDDHHRCVYAHFGLAIYCAQCLEHGLVNAFIYLDLIPNHPRPVPSTEAWQRSVDGFMDREFEKTLGQLIRKLGEITSVPPGLASRLDNALRQRNWLAHDYFRERATGWLTEEGRNQMVSELQECQRLFLEADKLLDATFKTVRERHGFTEERLQREYEKYLAEARAVR